MVNSIVVNQLRVSRNIEESFIDVFIVDYDYIFATKIRDDLEVFGYTSVIAENLLSITEEVVNLKPKVLLISMELPYKSGLEYYEEISKFLNIPVVFMLPEKNDLNDVLYLNSKGYCYILKPFSVKYLIPVMNKAIKKSVKNIGETGYIMVIKDVVLNISTNTVMHNDNIAELNKDEFRILYLLMSRKNSVVGYDDIIYAMSVTGIDADNAYIDICIKSILNKLKRIGVKNFVLQVNGEGYIIYG